MSVARRQVPTQCSLLAGTANDAYWDCYEAPLARTDLSMQQLCLAVFAHHPMWMKRLLALRTRLVAPFGIGGATLRELTRPVEDRQYAIGERIARFELRAQTDCELIMGGDDKHLDFRVSLAKIIEEGRTTVALTTLVMPHNLFGRIYLRAILPFHRFGVRKLLENAAAAGRI